MKIFVRPEGFDGRALESTYAWMQERRRGDVNIAYTEAPRFLSGLKVIAFRSAARASIIPLMTSAANKD